MPVYRDEKTKKYYVKFYYQDWQGIRHQKFKRGFTRSQEAKKYERDFLEKQQGCSDMLFENLCANYLADSAVRLKKTTHKGKVYVIESKFIPLFKGKRVAEITPSHIRKWQNTLLQKDYSPTYLRQLNSRLSAIFNFAVKYYQLKANPVPLAGSIGKKNADGIEFWTLEEFNTFISAINSREDYPFYVAYILLFYTGLRSGEMLALLPGDVDTTNHVLHVTKNYARVNGEDLLLTPKTPNSKRDVTLPSFLCSLLAEYMEKLPDIHLRLFFQLNKYSLNRKLKQVAQKSGVKAIRVHDLRHSHASLLIELGFSPLLISKRLGHEKIETTLQVYSHLYPDKENEVSNKLETIHQRINIVSK